MGPGHLSRHAGDLYGRERCRRWSGELSPGANRPTRPWPSSTACPGPTNTDASHAGELVKVSEPPVRPPALIIVGPVVSLERRTFLVPVRPLFGTRMLVTRPEEQAQPLGEQLASLGAEVCSAGCGDWRSARLEPCRRGAGRLDRYDWLVFSSGNGVRYCWSGCSSWRRLAALGRVKLAAIGPGTAAELARYHLRADLVPGEYRAEALAEALWRRRPRPVSAGPRQRRPRSCPNA